MESQTYYYHITKGLSSRLLFKTVALYNKEQFSHMTMKYLESVLKLTMMLNKNQNKFQCSVTSQYLYYCAADVF